jgi:hypothetical protein
MPTYEGLEAGLMQALKLSAILLALNVFFAFTRDTQLVYALHLLLQPLQKCGLVSKHLITRLMLTMRFMREPALTKVTDIFSFFEIHPPPTLELKAITFEVMTFGFVDAVAVFALCMVWIVLR